MGRRDVRQEPSWGGMADMAGGMGQCGDAEPEKVTDQQPQSRTAAADSKLAQLMAAGAAQPLPCSRRHVHCYAPTSTCQRRSAK